MCCILYTHVNKCGLVGFVFLESTFISKKVTLTAYTISFLAMFHIDSSRNKHLAQPFVPGQTLVVHLIHLDPT